MQTGRQQQRQPHGHAHQRGISLMPAIAAVFLVTIIALQIDMPRKQQQLQRMQSSADTNSSVQLLSATLSYFNEHTKWPTSTSQLKPYLPILPSDTDLDNMVALKTDDITGDTTMLLFNAKSHTQAKRLAWQFNKLDMDIVNKSGGISDDQSQNTWVKIQLDHNKYGAWAEYSEWTPAECPYETGQQTRTAQYCKKYAIKYPWCLGSSVQTKYCELPAEWELGDQGTFKYGPCFFNEQTKIPTKCNQGWKDGKRVDCPRIGLFEQLTLEKVKCQAAYYQRDWGDWQNSTSPADLFEFQKRYLLQETCIAGIVNETTSYCDPSLKLSSDAYQMRSRLKKPIFSDNPWHCTGTYSGSKRINEYCY